MKSKLLGSKLRPIEAAYKAFPLSASCMHIIVSLFSLLIYHYLDHLAQWHPAITL